MALLKDVESSILFSPKLSKVLSITIYNLSRFNESRDYFNEAAYRLRQQLSGPQRQEYLQVLQRLTQELQEGRLAQLQARDAGANILAASGQGTPQTEGGRTDSRVMEALIRLIEKQSEDQAKAASDAGQVKRFSTVFYPLPATLPLFCILLCRPFTTMYGPLRRSGLSGKRPKGYARGRGAGAAFSLGH